jgi:hypothetical protein
MLPCGKHSKNHGKIHQNHHSFPWEKSRTFNGHGFQFANCKKLPGRVPSPTVPKQRSPVMLRKIYAEKNILSHVGETSTFICDDIFCFCKEQGSPIAISKTQLTHPRARFSLFLCHIAMENRNVLSSVNHRTIHGPSIPLSKVQFQYTKVHSYSIDSINPGT